MFAFWKPPVIKKTKEENLDMIRDVIMRTRMELTVRNDCLEDLAMMNPLDKESMKRC